MQKKQATLFQALLPILVLIALLTLNLTVFGLKVRKMVLQKYINTIYLTEPRKLPQHFPWRVQPGIRALPLFIWWLITNSTARAFARQSI